MRACLLLTAVVLTACHGSPRPAASPAPASSRAVLTGAILAQLERAASDWNRGDLDGFLSDYAPESTTTFVDGQRPRAGMDFIRGLYAPRFAAGAPRDSLHFEEVAARPLSASLAVVTGRFILERGSEITASGPFTLVMERRLAGWRILHDHSSSDPR